MELHLTYSLLLSIQLLFVAWAALHYWGENRERVIGAFALKQGVGILFSLAYMGYARALMSDFLAPDWPDRWFSICIVSFVAVVIWFNYCLLKEYQPPKWGMRLQLIGVVFLPFEIVLILLDHVQVVLRFNMLMIVLSPILTLLLAITAKPSQGLSSPAVSQKAIIAINIFTLLTVSAQSLPAMGLTETFSLSRFNFLIHGVFNSFLMFLMLHVRAKRMEAQRRQTQTALTLAEQQTQQERQQRLEQSKFLSMLTHELKTPLSILRMVQGAKQVTPALALEADRAIQDMTDVIEHCVQSEKITDKKLNVTTEYVDPIEVLHALCGSVRYQSRLHVQAQALPILSTDPKLLRMLLGNLLDNAKKYSPEDSPIGVAAATETRGKVAGVRFSISNLPGKAGWPAVDKVFQKHYRSPGAHESTGCGLGLYLVEHIVQMLGGQVSYQPTASKIRFTLWIPA
jgi:signal transduction histidine kinase